VYLPRMRRDHQARFAPKGPACFAYGLDCEKALPGHYIERRMATGLLLTRSSYRKPEKLDSWEVIDWLGAQSRKQPSRIRLLAQP
jgi:hypothetical protein